ncbi:hypothetical protein P154DRAFT_134252 [Amniculicola lignicola CBS 123094]|uniref:Uncharacterized protein n=1 Tax=Amniculicola lignicola CBS 123094 TaxID=1392246 RepID=A0A6A5WMD0_9PLEO|nr:hypothetical protein P154DRAFT_134252 [Amniculicola lignicola CBS 123094]
MNHRSPAVTNCQFPSRPSCREPYQQNLPFILKDSTASSLESSDDPAYGLRGRRRQNLPFGRKDHFFSSPYRPTLTLLLPKQETTIVNSSQSSRGHLRPRRILPARLLGHKKMHDDCRTPISEVRYVREFCPSVKSPMIIVCLRVSSDVDAFPRALDGNKDNPWSHSVCCKSAGSNAGTANAMQRSTISLKAPMMGCPCYLIWLYYAINLPPKLILSARWRRRS